MSIHKGTVEAISHKYDKFAVLIDEKWYNTKKEYAEEWPVKPTVGDVITFDDGGKKYLGKMKIVSSSGSSGTPKASSGGGYSNIGVEVGHASNLAMRMMEQHTSFDVGSVEYYKELVKRTEEVYKIMKSLKSKLGAPDVKEVKVPKKETPVEDEKAKESTAEGLLEDLF